MDGDRFGDNGIGVFEMVEGRGDDGRRPCRRAVVGKTMRKLQQIGDRRRHHVDAESAIDLKVDKAGKKIVVDALRRAMPANRIDTAAEGYRAGGEMWMRKRIDGEAGQRIIVAAPYQC